MTTPYQAGAPLITVLGAQPGVRQALLRALQARLAARRVASLHLPCVPPPQPWHGDWLQARACQQDAALAQEHLVLSEGSTVHAAAALQPAAPPELQAAAQADLARSALVLLCAPSACDDAAVQAIDAQLRRTLAAARAGFSVVHGPGPAAHAQGWQALCLGLGWPVDAGPGGTTTGAGRWQGACDKCSDPGCEHRVFSDLLARRGRA